MKVILQMFELYLASSGKMQIRVILIKNKINTIRMIKTIIKIRGSWNIVLLFIGKNKISEISIGIFLIFLIQNFRI